MASNYFLAFSALNFAHRALAAAEILAFAAALNLRLLLRGAPFFTGAARPPVMRSSSFPKRSICSRIAMARFSFLTDSAVRRFLCITNQ